MLQDHLRWPPAYPLGSRHSGRENTDGTYTQTNRLLKMFIGTYTQTDRLLKISIGTYTQTNRLDYSGGNSCCKKALFIKQKCQIQIDVGQYENAATPLRTRGINTTHQPFQMRYITFDLKGLKSYQPSNFKCLVSIVKQTLNFYFS